MTANPSHLEVVDPVVLGKVRAKQTANDGNINFDAALAVLVHGDAAFSGQGIVSEVIQLSKLEDFSTGGSIHIILNNQIGFTTESEHGRSSPYASDIAKLTGSPVFHVNGDDPEAVVGVFQLAVEYRQKFHEDVFIDMYCYRRHGHHELDDPVFTQPSMYHNIEDHPTLLHLYRSSLVQEELVTEEQVEDTINENLSRLKSAYEKREEYEMDSRDWLECSWKDFPGICPKADAKFYDTSIEPDTFNQVLKALVTTPEGFKVHPKLKETRFADVHKILETDEPVTWGIAEAVAFGSLMLENYGVRISGQDSERGTFSQRHSTLYCQKTGQPFVSLRQLIKDSNEQGWFNAINSPLAENAILGFEYGYSLEDPKSFVAWEAQYGDFMNGAQVIIDQFVSAGEDKWLRMSGIVMLLPHGYEGQGPDHSSARLERFLQFCSDHSDKVRTNFPFQ